MHSFSVLIIVFSECFLAPLVLLYAYYSCLNFTLPGVAMLKDVPRGFYVWGAFKNFYQKFGQLDIKIFRVAV